MPANTTMTIEVSADVEQKLEQIAADTRRTKSYIAAEAVAAYVDRELDIVEGIKKARVAADAGGVVAHDDAMAEIYAVISAAETRRASKA